MKIGITILFLQLFLSIGASAQLPNVLNNNVMGVVDIDKQAFERAKAYGRIQGYLDFVKSFGKSNLKAEVEDSLLAISKRTNDLRTLSYCFESFVDKKKLTALLALHSVFTNDGETQTLDLFYKKYNHSILREVRVNDYKIAKLGDDLSLENPYTDLFFAKYDTYIRMAAPREKAFVALQRMIASNINKKEWKLAIAKVEIYSPFFGSNNKRIVDLIALLASKTDKSIKIFSAGNSINTFGGEYLPVLTADEKQMYYCGRDKVDNIGGEDIFVSNKVNGKWSKGQLIPSLSTPETNDSPLSISTDESMLLIFKSGRLNYAERTSTGWSKPTEFPSQINAGSWQADAMITSNGRGLIFSSTKNGGANLFGNRKNYHGDLLYPSDIYISLMNAQDKWGEPINLGNTINTRYCDRMPFLHPDMKTLYFSSDGHGGLGKMDIFKSTRLADSCWNCWSEPINLGTEINSSESDADFKITTSGDKAFFSYEKITYYQNSTLYLLDVSGSMNGQKLEALKKATFTVGKKAMQNNTEVSIITFGGNCKQPIVNIFPFSKDIDSLSLFIDKIKTVDGTPMYEAYIFACNYMQTNSSVNSKNKTITLMTDGNSTSCIKLDNVLKTIKEKNQLYKTQSIAFNVPDVSIAYNDLKVISSFTKGKFHPTNNFEDLTGTFEGSINEIFNFNSANYNKDIYWINLPHNLRPDKVSSVSGKLVDKNNRPVSAKIRLEDLETGEIVGQSKTNPNDGSFFLVLPSGKIYGYYVDEDEYFPVSNNVDLKQKSEIIMLNNDLKAITFNQLLDEGMIVPLNNIFFQFGKYSLLPSSISELKRVAQIIKKSNFKVEIIGHTDIIGPSEMNQALSERRAQSVTDFFISEGCDVNKFVTKGYGELKPTATNINEIGRAKNRRVELKFIK